MNNPYQTPTAAPLLQDNYVPRFLSVSGRIGRLRYITYGLGMILLVQLLVVQIIWMALGVGSWLSDNTLKGLPLIILGAIYLPAMMFCVGYLVRRLNDVNLSGWWALLILVPLVNLLVICIAACVPGTAGPNRHGPAPVSNSRLLTITAWLLMSLFALGTLLLATLPVITDFAPHIDPPPP